MRDRKKRERKLDEVMEERKRLYVRKREWGGRGENE